MKVRQSIILCSFSTLLIMSGCSSLGPDYETPNVQVEKNWQSFESPIELHSTKLDVKWWQKSFNDQELNQLIDKALKQNLSLHSAGLRVLQSQQQLAIAVGNQYPQQQFISASAGRFKDSGAIFNNYDIGFNLGWESDFWGKFSRQIESATANLEASVANYDAAVVSIIAQVAQNYILIRKVQTQIAVARENIKLQTESLRIAIAKFEAGDVSELDPDQAQSLLMNTKASLPALETVLQQLKNALAVLLGQPPQTYNYLLVDKANIPVTPASIVIGLPQDLIRQRPDIRAAERLLASQSAQIGFAETELYPSLSIGGSIGSNAMQSNQLFDSESETWSIAGGFRWNIFNYGRLKSNVRLQDALFQQLLVDYRNKILQAQSDVENALVEYLKSQEQLSYYQQAAKASAKAVIVSQTQYENGLISFNRVITTLSNDAEQQNVLAEYQGIVADNLINVFLALGGGWQVRDDVDPVNLLPESIKEEMKTRTDSWNEILK